MSFFSCRGLNIAYEIMNMPPLYEYILPYSLQTFPLLWPFSLHPAIPTTHLCREGVAADTLADLKWDKAPNTSTECLHKSSNTSTDSVNTNRMAAEVVYQTLWNETVAVDYLTDL